ncbi:aminoglycoside phosphotransferase family protein [Parasphingorhabdus cellanae]|uniref:Aminoglycoside phosphotransferase family protein n=1 Tax=Parasphingorhabdus cellanae TaxID=2806553 RepID=A0ABX7T8R0_9SPHN|nr:aminoglycoside phosphotransferase family protein [Parasphingorhabdus cellanae]QTD56353.1 aminoglycoside phosphotransferase family protein [Parasphingorhabdus cellanae]
MARRIEIDTTLVNKLIAQQFPKWSNLTLTQVIPGGWDHRTFRLGETLSVRLPSAECYAAQIEKEYYWLPILEDQMPVSIASPIALGVPTSDFPWPWSIFQWIEGNAATIQEISITKDFPDTLASFLIVLHKCPITDAPKPDSHNFFRGAHLSYYSKQIERVIDSLGKQIDQAAVRDLWSTAIASQWEQEPVWIHGDVAPGNLLLKSGKLTAVIDFGCCAIGDPSCDLTIAWTGLNKHSRRIFRDAIPLDEQTWERARGWAIWKALLVLNGNAQNKAGENSAEDVLRLVLAEHQDCRS